MNVLIACEYSGTVRDAFISKGHDAVSCDLIDTESIGPHFILDALTLIEHPEYNDCTHWDMLIAFPPCTDLAVSGARWFPEKRKDGRQQASISFFMALATADIPKIAIENPIGIMSTQYRKPDQIVQPWQYGHGETKATCLWLKGLPDLQPTDIVEGREQRVWKMPPSEHRAKERARSFQGIAIAMANQWG